MLTESYGTMFRYLLEMHKDGKSLCRLELNMPCTIFRDVQMDSLKILEAMMVDFGKSQGWDVVKKTPEVADA